MLLWKGNLIYIFYEAVFYVEDLESDRERIL